MKSVYFILLTALSAMACVKPVESDVRITELDIIQTKTPATGTVNQNIVSEIRVMGPDLCYRFAYFTVNPQQFVVDIHAKGTYPNRPTACAQAIYNKDTTLSIPVSLAGTYILRFYNGNQLFKADTVQVN